MRLVGFSLDNHMGRVWSGHLPLDDVTVVLGPNDAGKSRTVNLLCSLLDGEAAVDWFWGSPVGAFAAELDENELQALDEALDRTEGTAASSSGLDEPPGAAVSARLAPADAAALDALLDQFPIRIFESNFTEFDGWRVWRGVSPAGLGDRELGLAERVLGRRTDSPSDLGWRHVPGGPMALDCAGTVDDIQLPAAQRVPTTWHQIAASLASEISYRVLATELQSRMLLWPVGAEPWNDAATAHDFWLGVSDDTAELRPSVRALSRLFCEVANETLPEFVSRRCSFDEPVSSPLVRWNPAEPVIFEMLTQPDDEEEGAQDFRAEDAADGFQIWLQLAALEAIDHIRRMPIDRDPIDEPWPPPRPHRPPLYALDEPERHLHPGLHRQAARWLADLVRQRRCQAIVITHSVPFLNLGSGARYAYVGPDPRQPSGSTIRAVSSDELTAMSEIATEIGLNRGQLLAGVHALLFVEGRADQVIVEALYRERLRDMGVALVPLSGAGNHAQLFESDLLLRYHTAPIALMLDNVSEAQLRSLQDDEQMLELALRGKKVSTEIKTMAHVIKNARRHGREILLLAHTGRDIFDLLDADLLRQRYPDFPGHGPAQRAYDEQRASKEANRKTYYTTRFGVRWDLPELIVIADRMAATGATHPELDAIMDSVERHLITGTR